MYNRFIWLAIGIAPAISMKHYKPKIHLSLSGERMYVFLLHRSQVGFGFVFMVSDSDSQFRIRKSNTKLENLKVIFWCFKEN